MRSDVQKRLSPRPLRQVGVLTQVRFIAILSIASVWERLLWGRKTRPVSSDSWKIPAARLFRAPRSR